MMHEKGINDHGGMRGLRDDSIAKAESIIAQQNSVFGVDRYPDLFTKAAMLLYFFAKDHCFPDGNKRVAIFAAVVLLEVNGYETTFDDEEGYEMTMEVSYSNIDELHRTAYIEYLAEWLKKHSKKNGVV